MRDSINVGFPATLTFSVVVIVGLLNGVGVFCKSHVSLKLERAFSHNDGMELSEIIDRDSLRHGRFLQQEQKSSTEKDFIDFTLEGTYDPYRAG